MSWTVVKESKRYSEHGSLGDSSPVCLGGHRQFGLCCMTDHDPDFLKVSPVLPLLWSQLQPPLAVLSLTGLFKVIGTHA
ncbi:Glutamine Amidotransferase-Like Class 1 Domain-Containing Protein 1 [Manis pentadactyla]|nr:Glutamine Amidotransferase-Like Class 1 Domain-Containing Protein 1 [Manis pentadactyla]